MIEEEPKDRSPMIDVLIDGCRLLPVPLQLFFVVVIYGTFHYPPMIYHYFWWLLFTFEMLIFFILVWKYVLYRNMSRIDRMIEIGIIWINTNQARKRINTFLLGGLSLVVITILFHLFYYKIFTIKIVCIYLVGVLFSLKGWFYLPVITLRYHEELYTFSLRDEYKKTKKTIEISSFEKLKVIDNGILFFNSKEEEIFKMEIDFLDAGDDSSLESIFHERIRVLRFLEGIFPNKGIFQN